MTWTYAGDPSMSDRDAVRFLVGDTDTDDQLVTDEEIAWQLTEEADVYGAASTVAFAIAGRFARKADKSVGDLRVSFSQQVQQYRELAITLRQRQGQSLAEPYAGGISISGKRTVENDTDRVRPAAAIGVHDLWPTPSDSDPWWWGYGGGGA